MHVLHLDVITTHCITFLIAAPGKPQIIVNSSTSAITVSWTFVPTADFYNVSINGSSYMNSLTIALNIYTFSNLKSDTGYTVSVTAINCGGYNIATTAAQTRERYASKKKCIQT